jgi:hypothetical protein
MLSTASWRDGLQMAFDVTFRFASSLQTLLKLYKGCQHNIQSKPDAKSRRTQGERMFQSLFVWMAGWFVLGIAALAWAMLCGVVAHWGEKEGLAFWWTFALCILLTPLAGVLLVLAFKPPRTGRSLAETASRG